MTFTDTWNICPRPAEGAVIAGNGWRITVLTDSLVRLEYEPESRFRDGATAAVINRRFPLPGFTAVEKDGRLTVETDATIIGISCIYIVAMVMMFIGWLGTRDERKAAK